MDRQKNNPNGFSLIELVLVVGMMGFIMTAFASFAAHMSRDLRAANQKIEQMTMGQDIQMGLRMDTAACDLTLGTDSTFNANQATGNSGPRINLPGGIVISSDTEERIAQPGELLRGTNSGLRVAITELEIIREVPTTNPSVQIYEGIFRITLDPNSLVRSLQPVSVPYFFETDPASPAGARRIVGCAPQPVGTPCPDGSVQTGILANGDSMCITAEELLGGANLSCPAGSVLAGINPDGTLNCLANSDIAPPPSSMEHMYVEGTSGPDSSRASCPEGWTLIGCRGSPDAQDGTYLSGGLDRCYCQDVTVGSCVVWASCLRVNSEPQ